MIEKQQQITFNKGITNVPSDAICDDGELSNCVGLTAEHGELKPIQNPSSVSEVSYELLYVHGDRYIMKYPITTHGVTTYKIVWKTKDGLSQHLFDDYYEGSIASIGNTLIVSTPTNFRYYLWKGVSYNSGVGYKYLGNNIPEPDVSFFLNSYGELVSEHIDGFSNLISEGGQIIDEQAWTDSVVGTYYKLVKKLHQKCLFAEPFVARLAVELYDGSYMMHSNPFILLPLYNVTDMVAAGRWVGLAVNTWSPFMYMKGYDLRISGDGYDYTDWSDVVRNVSIFVSREVGLYNTDTDAKFNDFGQHTYTVGKRLVGGYVEEQGNWDTGESIFDAKILDPVPSTNVKSALEEESVFFKLCDLGISWSGGTKSTSYLFSYNVLDNLEVQQQLSNEDYHTHDNHVGEQLYSYNGRLHISGITRYFFRGFKHFFTWNRAAGNSITYYIRVKISLDGEDKYITQSVETREAIGEVYFYYPDPRAKSVEIYNGGNLLYTRQLTEHPGLNGAYWCDNFPTDNGYAPSMTQASGSVTSTSITEELPDTIMASEVDNPWLFLAKGYTKVNAPVVGMAAVTMALSEYQHGHQPLIVFTKEGIQSLTLNSEGYYTSIQSVSREVCNNASSITQVDYGIYFASDKGLMYLNTGGVKCVSNQLRGTEFDKFIDSCFMAYDYRDSLLHIYKTTQTSPYYHYVYNMKTGTFSTMPDAYQVVNAVSDYPDTLIQRSQNGYTTYSLLSKPDEQDDPLTGAGTYSAQLVTRPMKLENSLALKSILQARHIMQLSTGATLKFRVWASNNLDSWVELSSLRGKPWKYYKFRYEFTNLKAVDRFAGTVLITQERRTDKLR